jgi:hypothetical protein
MSTYYLHDGRNEIGPFTIDTLKKQRLSRNTPIRLEGKNNWAPAEKIGELKEQVAPRKIKRPKDIFPVLMEKAVDFNYRRPKAASAVLLCAALLAGISIYSVGKSAGKNLPETAVASVSIPVAASTPLIAATEKKEPAVEAPKEDKQKLARMKWNKFITGTNSNYGIGFLGGIKDLKVIVNNRSDYSIDQAVAKVTYIKADGDVWKTKLITIYGIPAHDSKEQSIADVNRGKKVTVSLQKVVSKKMQFSYTAGKKIANSEDPYVMQ